MCVGVCVSACVYVHGRLCACACVCVCMCVCMLVQDQQSMPRPALAMWYPCSLGLDFPGGNQVGWTAGAIAAFQQDSQLSSFLSSKLNNTSPYNLSL